ncbi:MAG: allantoate amidohydrolase [Microbacteriaceae bacterium]
MTTFDAAWIMAGCDELASHSQSATGIDRRYLSREHAAVNAIAARWMREAGLETWQDAAGNQCGRLEGAEPGLPALVLGSHLDTVPDAGRYDGILGVLTAIAAAARMPGGELPFALEVVAFGDEEGTRFGRTLLGSAALAGSWQSAWADELVDAEGVPLRAAAAAFGLDPDAIGEAARDPRQVLGYLEVHIEQGPILEAEDRRLAVVGSIAGARRMTVTLTGESRHCATPWSLRRDALAGAAEAIAAIERIGRERDTPVTVGRIRVEPDAVNVIPGLAELSIDIRDADDERRDASLAVIMAELERIRAARGLGLAVHETHAAAATRCAPWLMEAFRAGIRSTGDVEPRELYSIAGHDAMAVAALADVAMLFVRCAGGVSHSPEESVRVEDVAAGLDALEAAVREVAALARAEG